MDDRSARLVTAHRLLFEPPTPSRGARALELLAWLTVALMGIVTLSQAVGWTLLPPLYALQALTPYLLLAVVDGKWNPLAINFRTLGARWGRWLVTVVLMGVICFVMWFLSALDGFFVTGAPGAIIAWLVLGLVSAWFTCAWALVYRSVNPR